MSVAPMAILAATYGPALARAVTKLLALGATGIFHVVGPRVHPRHEFTRMAARAFGLPVALIPGRPTSELGLGAPRPLRSGLNVDKLIRTLGHGLTDPADALAELAAAEAA